MVARRDNSNLGDEAYWPDHLKRDFKPRDRGPHTWKAPNWQPEKRVSHP